MPVISLHNHKGETDPCLLYTANTKTPARALMSITQPHPRVVVFFTVCITLNPFLFNTTQSWSLSTWSLELIFWKTVLGKKICLLINISLLFIAWFVCLARDVFAVWVCVRARFSGQCRKTGKSAYVIWYSLSPDLITLSSTPTPHSTAWAHRTMDSFPLWVSYRAILD